MGYVPAGLVVVAVVVHVGRVVSTFVFSPFTKPLATQVSVGFGWLKAFAWLFAAIVSGAGVTVKTPGTKVIAYFVELSPEQEIA